MLFNPEVEKEVKVYGKNYCFLNAYSMCVFSDCRAYTDTAAPNVHFFQLFRMTLK